MCDVLMPLAIIVILIISIFNAVMLLGIFNLLTDPEDPEDPAREDLPVTTAKTDLQLVSLQKEA